MSFPLEIIQLIRTIGDLVSVLKTTNVRVESLEEQVSELQRQNKKLRNKPPSDVVCYVTVDPNGSVGIFPTETDALNYIFEGVIQSDLDSKGTSWSAFTSNLAKYGKSCWNGETYLLKEEKIRPGGYHSSSSEDPILKKLRDQSNRKKKIDELKEDLGECLETSE